jgi:hypothetical protein
MTRRVAPLPTTMEEGKQEDEDKVIITRLVAM